MNDGKLAGIRDAIIGRRAPIFYLPPYSADLNPIEMAFGMAIALARTVRVEPRSAPHFVRREI